MKTAITIVLAYLMLIFSAHASEVEVKIVAFGDSLTAGYGLQPEEAFPAQLESALNAKGLKVTLVNAGVSGDTTAGGLSRVDWVLQENPHMVILELGANDALRGVDPKNTADNLDQILAKFAEKKIPVLLAGMKASPSMGLHYSSAFNGIFDDLADKYDVELYPFFLEGVAMNPALNLPDGVHPTAAGIGVIVQNILPQVEEMVKDVVDSIK